MTADDLTPLRDEVAEVLGEHDWMRGLAACRCDWQDPAPNYCGEEDRHRAHVADALLPLLARVRDEARVEALQEFARKWADWTAQCAPQTRGGAAYRAICEAQAIEAALGEATGREA